MQISSFVGGIVEQYRDKAWIWFSTLNREEWMIVLTVTCLIGFVLVRTGFGIRNQC